MQNAYKNYYAWGATAKIAHLENQYPQFVTKKLLSSSSIDHTIVSTISTTTSKYSSGNLELNSIIKASQSLSGEVNIEKLLKKMLMIVMENASAEYAVFIKNEDDNYLIQAKGKCDEDSIIVMKSEKIEDSKSIPLNLIKYLVRTQKSIVLDNALNGEAYSDNYIKSNEVKSVFCHPIINKNELVAILYLENNLSTHVFTEERIETVSILSSQIAVSIENAMLYDNLEKKVERRTEQLQKAIEELEHSHNHITNSIIYANRIQKAVLPAIDTIAKMFPEHFVLMKPRDIISGDFYLFREFKNMVFIAAVDCTGHRVLGAFMSMLGIAFLNELVVKPEIQNPAQLLDELRKQVKFSLQQTGQVYEQQDGMDIAFVVLNLENNKLSFAGANNPLWIFRNKELIEIKGDRMPVGIYLKEHPFSNHEIQLKKDDVFYILSDGYHSQFQNITRETLKISRFRELLTEIPVSYTHLTLPTKRIV